MTKTDLENKSLVVIIAVCYGATTMVMPMIPALIFMFWCDLYPQWLRAAGMIPIVLFSVVYISVLQGGSYFGTLLAAGYAVLQVLEVVWGVYLFKDWQRVAARTATGAARQ